MSIRKRPENIEHNHKTIDDVLKWPADVRNKKEIMPAVSLFGQTFYLSAR